MALLLLHANATVTICHSKSKDLPGIVRRADIIVAAIGKAAMVTPDFVRPGATVIDVGQIVVKEPRRGRANLREFSGAKLESFRTKGSILAGDVHPDVVEVAGAYTPVPGGVGPLTIAMLMSNTVKAARMRRGARAPAAASSHHLMLRIGLTGGIASGKSTVAALLRDYEYPVLDADSLARELLEPGQDAYNEVVSEFGESVLAKGGAVDRAEARRDRFFRRAKARAAQPNPSPAHPGRGGEMVRGARPSRRSRHRVRGRRADSGSGREEESRSRGGLLVPPEQQLERLQQRGLSPAGREAAASPRRCPSTKSAASPMK